MCTGSARANPNDLSRLAGLPGKVRLVKCAYTELLDIAVKEKSNVNDRYRKLLRYAFQHFERGVAVATHYPEVISLVKFLHQEYGTGFKLQMLMGVSEDEQVKFSSDYGIWQHVPLVVSGCRIFTGG